MNAYNHESLYSSFNMLEEINHMF